MGQLTRTEMEEVIRGGGSVMIGLVIHSQIATLPTEVELAVGNEEKEVAADSALDQQIANLLAQKKQLANARAAREKAEKARSKHGEENEGDANENPDTAKGEIPGSGIGGKITELPPSGDRVGAETLERQNELARGETNSGEGDGASGESANDQSGEGDTDKSGASGKESHRTQRAQTTGKK